MNLLLLGLIRLTNLESNNGDWRVILDYDNYQDGARVLDGNGNILGECYELGDVFEECPEKQVEKQFLIAIERAIKKYEA